MRENLDKYTVIHDEYCWKNSNVLRNKLGIKDSKTLLEAERAITSLRTTQALSEGIHGRFDEAHFKAVHHFLFSDLYDWAGKVRTVNISKGSLFCLVQFIEPELSRIFSELKKENFLQNIPDGRILSQRLSYYISELNAVHPFREGNGRTQRVFATLLARKNGFELRFQNIDPALMEEASIESFGGNYEPMNRLICACLTKISSIKETQ